MKKVSGLKKKQLKTNPPIRMRLWWIPQVPMKPFHVYMDDSSLIPYQPPQKMRIAIMVELAKDKYRLLANYDQFQFENNIKPDYCNAGGLEILNPDGEWEEWYDENGDDISDLINRGVKSEPEVIAAGDDYFDCKGVKST